MEMLRAAGWTITYDWTKEPLWDVKPSRELTPEEARECALRDADGVAGADVLWLMLPESKSEGAHFELGFFLGMLRAAPSPAKGVVVSGDVASLGRIFPRLAHAQFENHANALEYLIGMR